MPKTKGGDKFKKALDDVAKRLRAGKTTVQVGFFEGNKYPDGSEIAEVAAKNEYGQSIPAQDGKPEKRVPPRPFFRRMINEGTPHWGTDLGKILKAANYDTTLALSRMGESMRNELVDSIEAQVYAPNAPSTIARKGHGTTLMDSGRMKKAPAYKVK